MADENVTRSQPISTNEIKVALTFTQKKKTVVLCVCFFFFSKKKYLFAIRHQDFLLKYATKFQVAHENKPLADKSLS